MKINLPVEEFQKAMKLNSLLEEGYSVKALDHNIDLVDITKNTEMNIDLNARKKLQLQPQ